MKTTTTLRGNFRVYWYEYPAGVGPYGSGGWSKNARHQPKPVLVCRQTGSLELAGNSVILDGQRKLKCTIVRESNGEVLREDYEVSRIKQDLFTNTAGRVELEPETATSAAPRPALGERKLAL